MNKKGIYAPTLVILSVFLLSYTIISFLDEDVSIAKVAGKNQVKLIEIYQKGEFTKQYLRQSSRNAINDALYEFGQNGGLKENKCKKNDLFIWNKECKPDKANFILYFDEKFKVFLKLNNLPKLNFDYVINKNQLIVKSKNSILFNLDSDKIESKQQKLIDYSVRETGYDHWIKEASQKFKVEANLIKSVIMVESTNNPLAKSSKNAYGLMQITNDAYKDVKKAFKVDWTFEQAKFDPRLNILTGTGYLKLQLNKFKDKDVALAAYNSGPGNVKKYGGIPPFSETQDYVKKVNNELNKITGSASFNIKEEAILTGTYEINPSFIENFDFDFESLDKLYEEVIKSQDCLKDKDISFDLSSCIKDKKGFVWKLNRESNFINFEIITNFKILKNENKRLIQDNLIIKFKTDLEVI